jgi:Immunity protein 74
MNIINITRGHILIQKGDRIAKAQGEMFFPTEGKMGFVLYADSLGHWEPPHHAQAITADEQAQLIKAIQQDFALGGHALEIEPPYSHEITKAPDDHDIA